MCQLPRTGGACRNTKNRVLGTLFSNHLNNVSFLASDDTSSDGGDSDSDDERDLLAKTAEILKDLENGNRGANDHESAETGGCDDEDHEKVVEDVDHESTKEPSEGDGDSKAVEDGDHESEKGAESAVSAERGVSADDVSAGEEMVTAAEEEDALTDPGLSIPEQEEALDDRAEKLNGIGAKLLVAEQAATNNKQLNSVSTCSELSEDELYQDVYSCDNADHEKEIPRKVLAAPRNIF